MNEHLFGFISGIVAGIVTNGIQGVSHYITKETLQESYYKYNWNSPVTI